MEKNKQTVVKEIFKKYLELEALLHEGMEPYENESKQVESIIVDLREMIDGRYKTWRAFFEEYFPSLAEDDTFHNLIHIEGFRQKWLDEHHF